MLIYVKCFLSDTRSTQNYSSEPHNKKLFMSFNLFKVPNKNWKHPTREHALKPDDPSYQPPHNPPNN